MYCLDTLQGNLDGFLGKYFGLKVTNKYHRNKGLNSTSIRIKNCFSTRESPLRIQATVGSIWIKSSVFPDENFSALNIK